MGNLLIIARSEGGLYIVSSIGPSHDALSAQFDPSRLRDLRERGERVKEQLTAAEATARSDSGTVSVTVGAGGVMRGVNFTAAARNVRPETLSSDVMHAYLQAARAAAEQSVEIMRTLVGSDSPTLQLMRDAIPPDPDADEQRKDADR